MIYVPESETFNKCYVVQNENVIRAYDTIPHNNTSYSYRDYYIKSDYIYKDGSGNWGNTMVSLPSCINSSLITHDFYYRIDFTNILLNVFIISFFGLYIPFKIFKSLFKGLR